jgi:hypothetical protein
VNEKAGSEAAMMAAQQAKHCTGPAVLLKGGPGALAICMCSVTSPSNGSTMNPVQNVLKWGTGCAGL